MYTLLHLHIIILIQTSTPYLAFYYSDYVRGLYGYTRQELLY